MANLLLDFVMELVRDPDAAARYAADPAAALADAHLTGVTSADVNNLIPMVADSMAIGTPSSGAGLEAGPNGFGGMSSVWTSGAATAAFDAFDTHIPGDGIHDIPTVVHQQDPILEHQPVPDYQQFDDPYVESVVDEVPNWHDSDAGDPWEPIHDWHPGPDHSGFDPTPQ